jgi:hypothetical protein
MQTPSVVVGIDVSKARLDVAMRPAGESLHVPYDAQGILPVIARLSELRPCPRNGASWRAGAGWVRLVGFFSILRDAICSPAHFSSKIRLSCTSGILQQSHSAAVVRE